MSFGGFLDDKSGSGGARINNFSDIPYNNNNVTNTTTTNNNNNDRMPFGAISQPRLVTTTPTLAKSMFNSPGLSLALVRDLVTLKLAKKKKRIDGTMLYCVFLFLSLFSFFLVCKK